ncbi:MAG TPA: helix-turn-helix domain-containing protein [Longimicrobium sp.]
MAETTKDKAGTTNRALVARWGGKEEILAEGWVGVPISFLKYFGSLNLTPTEAIFIIELMGYKRDERAPFPGYKALAKRMGVSPDYARKLARGLEAKEYIRRQVRVGTTNRFDLSPLFERLAARAKQEAEARAERASRAGKA